MPIQLPIVEKLLATNVRAEDSLLIDIAQRVRTVLIELGVEYKAELQAIEVGIIDGKSVTLFPEEAVFSGDEDEQLIANATWEDAVSRSSLDITSSMIDFTVYSKRDSSDSTKYELALNDLDQELTEFRETVGQGV